MMKDLEKNTLFLEVLNKTGGLWDPRMVIKFIDILEEWLPESQSAAGSQNTCVECAVEGFNDCLHTIKQKLR